MPRHLQGWGTHGQGNRKNEKGGKRGEAEEEPTSLPIQCMGEGGRDYLRRYLADSDFAKAIVKQIDEEGYCVLSGIISAEEADEELERAWRFVERVSPSVKRDDWNTWWPSGGGPDPWPHAQRDMMQLHQAGWVFSDLREKISERVFERLYGTKELHVSKDGFTFQRPTSDDLHRTPNDHFDQGTRWMGLQCIQGSVALTDQSENDGCFQVWPGSHAHREEILGGHRHHKAKSIDFIILSLDEHDFLRQRGIAPKRIPVKRGDVILWRSDVAHCGAPPVGRCDTYRLVAYICCLPAELTPEVVYEQKRRAYQRLETGTHYPTREEWFVKNDRHKRVDWKPYFNALPELTQRQRELYGLERYISEGQSVSSQAKPEKVSAKQSPTATVRSGPVEGLELWRATATVVREALAEVRPHFQRNHHKSSSDMFEVGWSFHAIEQDKVMRIGKRLEDFPCLQALINEILSAINPECDTIREDTVNIICRRYTQGQGLPKHLDRPQLFDEDVYGCVLHNTSDRALSFELQDRRGTVLDGPHVLDEQPGVCFRARGPARYDWIHGVEELGHGERISITWRWIQQGPADEGHENAKTASPKGKGKINGKASKSKGDTKSSGKSQKAKHDRSDRGAGISLEQSPAHVADTSSQAPGYVERTSQHTALDAQGAQTRRTRWGRGKQT